MGSVSTRGVLFDGVSLTLTLEVGVSVACSLLLQDDGHFEGECIDPSGVESWITMFPPER